MKVLAVCVGIFSVTIAHAMGPEPKPGVEKDPIWTEEKSGYATTVHIHDAASITSGILDDARLPAEVSRLGQQIEGNEVATGTLSLQHIGASGAQSNDVPQWNGTAWVPSPIPSAAAEMRYGSVPPVAMISMAQPVPQGHFYQANSERLVITGSPQAGNLGFVAPLDLPHGATLHEVTYSFLDNDSSRRIQFYIQGTVQAGGLGAGWVDGGFTTEGASTQHVRRTQSFQTPRVIDNRNRSYVLSVVMDAGAGTNLQFMGASIGYSVP